MRLFQLLCLLPCMFSLFFFFVLTFCLTLILDTVLFMFVFQFLSHMPLVKSSDFESHHCITVNELWYILYINCIMFYIKCNNKILRIRIMNCNKLPTLYLKKCIYMYIYSLYSTNTHNDHGTVQWRILGFSDKGRGWGVKNISAHAAHITSAKGFFTVGIQGPLKGPGSRSGAAPRFSIISYLFKFFSSLVSSLASHVHGGGHVHPGAAPAWKFFNRVLDAI